MHQEWSDVIRSRTSSIGAQMKAEQFLGLIAEFEDEGDYWGAKTSAATKVADWFAAAQRTGASVPFDGISDVLELMSRLKALQAMNAGQFTAPFSPEDEYEFFVLNGLKVLQLVTREAIIREVINRPDDMPFGCKAYYGAPSKDREHWIVRDAGDDAILATVLVDASTIVSVAIREPARTEDTANILAALVPVIGPALRTPATIPGLVQTVGPVPGAFHPIQAMPDDVVVEGDLRISDDHVIVTRLPEGLTVRGNLEIVRCPELERLPRNLRVEGDMSIEACPRLTSISEGLLVKGEARFGYDTDLDMVASTCRFEGNLYVRNEKALKCSFTVLGEVRISEMKSHRVVPYPKRSILARLLKTG